MHTLNVIKYDLPFDLCAALFSSVFSILDSTLVLALASKQLWQTFIQWICTYTFVATIKVKFNCKFVRSLFSFLFFLFCALVLPLQFTIVYHYFTFTLPEKGAELKKKTESTTLYLLHGMTMVDIRQIRLTRENWPVSFITWNKYVRVCWLENEWKIVFYWSFKFSSVICVFVMTVDSNLLRQFKVAEQLF